jgi:hypothetical protein
MMSTRAGAINQSFFNVETLQSLPIQGWIY